MGTPVWGGYGVGTDGVDNYGGDGMLFEFDQISIVGHTDNFCAGASGVVTMVLRQVLLVISVDKRAFIMPLLERGKERCQRW